MTAEGFLKCPRCQTCLLRQNKIWEREREKCGLLLFYLISDIYLLVNRKIRPPFNREGLVYDWDTEEIQKFLKICCCFQQDLIFLTYCVLMKCTDIDFFKRKVSSLRTSVSFPTCRIWSFMVWQWSSLYQIIFILFNASLNRNILLWLKLGNRLYSLLERPLYHNE